MRLSTGASFSDVSKTESSVAEQAPLWHRLVRQDAARICIFFAEHLPIPFSLPHALEGERSECANMRSWAA
jgi:hypothetical protein